VHQNQQAGFYKIDLDASDLQSGVYFCQLKAGEVIQTKKMLLIK